MYMYIMCISLLVYSDKFKGRSDLLSMSATLMLVFDNQSCDLRHHMLLMTVFMMIKLNVCTVNIHLFVVYLFVVYLFVVYLFVVCYLFISSGFIVSYSVWYP